MTNSTQIERSALIVAMAGMLAACAQAERDSEFPPFSPELNPAGDEVDSDEDEDEDEVNASDETDHSNEVDDYILSLGKLTIDDLFPKQPVACDPTNWQMDCDAFIEDSMNCHYQYYKETDHFETFIALQPNSAALWPGSIVRGADANEGLLSPIGLDRATLTFSLSLENLTGSPVGTMESPTLSSYRSERERILEQGIDGATPANISYEIKRVESSSQLSLLIKGSVQWPGASSIEGMFSFDDGEFANSYLVDFTQSYYTVDVDTPHRPSDLFTDSVSVSDLESFVNQDSPPMYVQSITYGRRVLFSIETDRSLTEVVAALDAAFGANTAAELDFEAKDTLESAKVSAFLLGGNGQAAVETLLGPDKLIDYLTTGGNYTSKSPGAPIAYKLAYLDNSATKFAFTAIYADKICEPQ